MQVSYRPCPLLPPLPTITAPVHHYYPCPPILSLTAILFRFFPEDSLLLFDVLSVLLFWTSSCKFCFLSSFCFLLLPLLSCFAFLFSFCFFSPFVFIPLKMRVHISLKDQSVRPCGGRGRSIGPMLVSKSMSADEMFASDVPPRYLLFVIFVPLTFF